MAKIIRYCKTNQNYVGENVFDVCRPNVLGNPYTHIKDRQTKALIKTKTRDEAIDLYEKYFNFMLNSDSEESKPFKREFNKLVEAYKKYPEIYIGCYCPLNERCHADIIIKQIIKTTVKNYIKNEFEK